MTAAPAASPPRLPEEFFDRREREIRLTELDGEKLGMLEPMYRGYDPRDRAQGIPPATPAGVRRWLDGLRDALHVAALHGDRPVGHAFLAPEPAGGADSPGGGGGGTRSDDGAGAVGGTGADRGRSAELAIFVDGPYQEAGIGTRLMEALLGLGARRGIRRVWLVVQRANGPAVRLYRKTGFEITDAGRAELEMARELEPEAAARKD